MGEFKRFLMRDYKRMRQWLIDCGYQCRSAKNDIIAEVFGKPGLPALYLYRPWLAPRARKQITVEYVAEPKPADLKNSIIYLPEYFKIAVDKHEAYLWAPRSVDSKPALFNFAEAAEHLGVSEASIRLAHYDKGAFPGFYEWGNNIVIPEQELIAWDLGRSNTKQTRRHFTPLPQLQAA